MTSATKQFQAFGLLLTMLTFAAGSAFASDWTGGTANWSSNVSPGWNGTGVPNGVGAIANFGTASTAGTTTQDIAGGVTVGTISLTSTSAAARIITLSNPITMNQDGAGSGFATIRNSSLGASSALTLSAGTLTLADDLLVSNTSTATAAAGAIVIASTIGGSGNVTFASNNNTTTSAAGTIRLTGPNSFSGSVLVQRGSVSFSTSTAFGNSANVITLGQSGQGNASIVSSTSTTVANNINVASGTGGTSVLGSTSTSNVNYSGSVTLNGNLSLVSASGTGAATTNVMTLSGAISGPGSISIVSNGAVAAGNVRFSNTSNSYQGGTFISAGNLQATADGTLGTGSVSLMASSVTLTLSGGVTNNYIADTASLSMVSGSTVNLNYTGADTISEFIINGVSLSPGVYNAGNQPTFLSGTGDLVVLGTAIPEPSTWAMLVCGAGLLVCAQLRRRA